MALKTFNIDEVFYKEFSDYCKKHGISMSKKIENFIKQELEKIRGNIKTIEHKTGNMKQEVEHSFRKYC